MFSFSQVILLPPEQEILQNWTPSISSRAPCSPPYAKSLLQILSAWGVAFKS
jgi:hypothetical protein